MCVLEYEALAESALKLLETGGGGHTAMQAMCRMLKERVPHYHWVGLYLTSRETPGLLELGPFAGEPTEHVAIPFGKGVCGSAVESGSTIVVDDVTHEDNYLACSLEVSSEIVVPIIKNGKVLGEIDIDSHDPAAFSEKDRRLLEKIARKLAGLL
ncbi:MAG: GAF domain-containing protein [Deltaproteobacteria bacterium]|nr:GAF domain-containing protein [Deltaproteobacteria bacterium]